MPRPVSLDNARRTPRTLGQARLYLLHERGQSLSQIARRLSKDLAWVSRVNAGRKRDLDVERELARALGLSLRQTFPEWYGRSEQVA